MKQRLDFVERKAGLLRKSQNIGTLDGLCVIPALPADSRWRRKDGRLLVVADSRGRVIGLLAVALATLAWALDNVLSRSLSDLDPGRVVMAKAALGATATIVLALLLRHSLPPVGPAAALMVVGATGYGLSLRLYLLAQREFGAARTGSVFAFAPFLSAVLSVVISGQLPGWGLVRGGTLMLAGVVLHLTETNTQGSGRSTRIAATSRQ